MVIAAHGVVIITSLPALFDNHQLLLPRKPLQFRLARPRFRQCPVRLAIHECDRPAYLRIMRPRLRMIVLPHTLREIICAADIESVISASEYVGVVHFYFKLPVK